MFMIGNAGFNVSRRFFGLYAKGLIVNTHHSIDELLLQLS